MVMCLIISTLLVGGSHGTNFRAIITDMLHIRRPNTLQVSFKKHFTHEVKRFVFNNAKKGVCF